MKNNDNVVNNNTKTIILIVGVLVLSLVVGIGIGNYLFELNNGDNNMLTNIDD